MVTNWVHFVNSSYFIMIAINLVRRMESKTCQELARLEKLGYIKYTNPKHKFVLRKVTMTIVIGPQFT